MGANTNYYYCGPVKYFCTWCGTLTDVLENEEVYVLSEQVTVESDGYHHRRAGYCKSCNERRLKQEKERRKKRTKRLVAAVAIVAIVLAVLLTGNALLTGNSLQTWTYNKLLGRCEGNPNLVAVQVGDGGAAAVAQMKKDLANGDYLLYLYGEGEAKVQKNTLDGKTAYYWVFKEGYGELSGKTFILQEGVLYEKGDEKLAYHSSAAEYAPLLDSLKAYCPENVCGKGPFTAESRLDDSEQKIIANLLYGEGLTALYYQKQGEDSTKTVYYEKSDTAFLQLNILETESGKAIAGTAGMTDFTEIK